MVLHSDVELLVLMTDRIHAMIDNCCSTDGIIINVVLFFLLFCCIIIFRYGS